jgi:hypothetical protein
VEAQVQYERVQTISQLEADSRIIGLRFTPQTQLEVLVSAVKLAKDLQEIAKKHLMEFLRQNNCHV